LTPAAGAARVSETEFHKRVLGRISHEVEATKGGPMVQKHLPQVEPARRTLQKWQRQNVIVITYPGSQQNTKLVKGYVGGVRYETTT